MTLVQNVKPSSDSDVNKSSCVHDAEVLDGKAKVRPLRTKAARTLRDHAMAGGRKIQTSESGN